LVNAIKGDRLHHAYLFCGVRGLGKTTAARVLAKCLVCENGPTPEPCNNCEQCRSVIESRSVDVIEIDGASNNSVDDIRGLREQVHYLPQFARRKIYIIDEVHMLTASAFNALLKTLEEPPPHVTFIFATTDPHKVLPTILSRVSRLDFRRVGMRDLVAHLRSISNSEQILIEDDALAVVASTAEGSVRDSLTALDKVIAFAEDPTRQAITALEARGILGRADRLAIAELAQSVFERDATRTLEHFDAITQIGCDLQQFALAFLQHLRDVVVLQSCGRNDALLDLPDALLARLETQAKSTRRETVSQHFDRFGRVLEQLEGSRVPKMVLEMALLDLVHAEALLPLGDLVARLSALGQGGAGPSGGGSGQAKRGDGRRAQASTPGRAQSASTEATSSAPLRARATTDLAASDSANSQPARQKTTTEGSTPIAKEFPKAAPEEHRQEAQTRKRAPAPSRPGGMSGLTDQFRAMLSGGEGSAAPAPPSAPSADANFALASPTREELAAESRPKPSPPGPEAGCPSSRCLPRESIDLDKVHGFEAWEMFLDLLRGEDDLLFAVLADFGLAELNHEELALASSRDSFATLQITQRPELRASLDQFLAAAFGQPLKLRLVDATPSLPELPSLGLLEAARKRSHQKRVESEVNSHPGIRAVMDTFGARVTAVEALSPPPRTSVDSTSGG
jgi:DNA polymerase-3 subunit gamma/tau